MSEVPGIDHESSVVEVAPPEPEDRFEPYRLSPEQTDLLRLEHSDLSPAEFAHIERLGERILDEFRRSYASYFPEEKLHELEQLDGQAIASRVIATDEEGFRLLIEEWSIPGTSDIHYERTGQELSDAELRVLLYIMRRTFGFKREADTISLSQLVSGITTRDGQVLDRGTGLSKATVARGLKGLREKGVIESQRNRSAERGDEPTTYRLRFKQAVSIPDKSAPLSQQQDRPRVSRVTQAVSQPRDTQQTVQQQTAIEYSKWDELGDNTEVGQGIIPDQTASEEDQTGSAESQPLGAILKHRVRRDVGRDDRAAISVAMERFAEELGDQAEIKVSISRALNLFKAAGVTRDVFVDVLFQAKGEVLDRRAFPGKAPVPRNRMAYFFALVEDRLGLREAVELSRKESA